MNYLSYLKEQRSYNKHSKKYSGWNLEHSFPLLEYIFNFYICKHIPIHI